MTNRIIKQEDVGVWKAYHQRTEKEKISRKGIPMKYDRFLDKIVESFKYAKLNGENHYREMDFNGQTSYSCDFLIKKTKNGYKIVADCENNEYYDEIPEDYEDDINIEDPEEAGIDRYKSQFQTILENEKDPIWESEYFIEGGWID